MADGIDDGLVTKLENFFAEPAFTGAVRARLELANCWCTVAWRVRGTGVCAFLRSARGVACCRLTAVE